tara:strand:+ start:428 stop:1270 length:843 start_codon:yes stop_codon:yes gene_type:complete
MHNNEKFRAVINDKFKLEVKNFYLPDQTYINHLIASLDKIEANSYKKSHAGFISEYKYCKNIGIVPSINVFAEGCLSQLLWINSILESGQIATSEVELDEKFDYLTPSMAGNPWVLKKVTKKGVRFCGDEPFQDSRVIINSENIVDIALALLVVLEETKEVNDVRVAHSKLKDSTLFRSAELQEKCLAVLKEIEHPVLAVDGSFINKTGMKGAIVVWYDKCSVLGFISKEISTTRSLIAKEVMNIIPGLSIEDSNFSKLNVAKKYKKEIEQKLVQIHKEQ